MNDTAQKVCQKISLRLVWLRCWDVCAEKKTPRRGNPQHQGLTPDSQDVAFLHRAAVKSQSSLQTGAEHENAVRREGQTRDGSAVLPERRQKI